MVDKLRAMKGFVTIVEKGSLTAAAAVLGISLPSMVRMLAVLERELGVTLLNRTTRRLHLTDDGQRYLDHCRVVLGHVQEAEATLRSSWAAPHGTLTLTASVAFGQAYVAPIVNEFMNLHPGVAVDLLLVNRVANLVEEGLDAAIRIGPLGDSSLVAIPLNRVRRVVCASASYLRRNGTPRHPKDLLAHRCVRFTGLAPRPEWPFRVKSRHVAVPIGSVLTCNQADVAIEACASSVGLGSFLS
jgi:DNA-binding transcriptional LysR family regulator